MTTKQKRTYSTSDLTELTKELQRLRAEGYTVVKGPEFSENAYFVELERGSGSVAESVTGDVVVAAVEVEPTIEKPVEAKPAHKPQRGPKPKKATAPTEA